MSQAKLEESLQELKAKYADPPKVAAEEEIAVAHNMRDMLDYYLNDKQGKKVELDSVGTLLKKGQLSLVAEQLNEDFLRDAEKYIQKCDLEFKHPNKPSGVVSQLYRDSRAELIRDGVKEPAFKDILLRMYTQENAYCYRMNAICGGYAAEPIDEDEKAIALLLSLASQKAGLKKAYLEAQQAPEMVARGSFGLKGFEERLAKVEGFLQTPNKLANLSPEEIEEINFSPLALGKKLTSTSVEEAQAEGFGKGATQYVIKIRNPEEIGEFYDIDNISAFHEKEVLTRAYDDVVMIPMSVNRRPDGVNEVEVFVMRSAAFVKENTTNFFNEKVASLEKSIDDQLALYNGNEQFKPVAEKLEQMKDLLNYLKATTPNLSHLDDVMMVNTIQEENLAQVLALGEELEVLASDTGVTPGDIEKLQAIRSSLEKLAVVYSNLEPAAKEPNELAELEELAARNLSETLVDFQRWHQRLPESDRKKTEKLITAVKNALKNHPVNAIDMQKVDNEARELSYNGPLLHQLMENNNGTDTWRVLLNRISNRIEDTREPMAQKDNIVRFAMEKTFLALNKFCDSIKPASPSWFARKKDSISLPIPEAIQKDLDKLRTGYKDLSPEQIKDLAMRIKNTINEHFEDHKDIDLAKNPLPMIETFLDEIIEKVISDEKPQAVKRVAAAQVQREQETSHDKKIMEIKSSPQYQEMERKISALEALTGKKFHACLDASVKAACNDAKYDKATALTALESAVDKAFAAGQKAVACRADLAISPPTIDNQEIIPQAVIDADYDKFVGSATNLNQLADGWEVHAKRLERAQLAKPNMEHIQGLMDECRTRDSSLDMVKYINEGIQKVMESTGDLKERLHACREFHLELNTKRDQLRAQAIVATHHAVVPPVAASDLEKPQVMRNMYLDAEENLEEPEHHTAQDFREAMQTIHPQEPAAAPRDEARQEQKPAAPSDNEVQEEQRRDSQGRTNSG